MLNGRATRMQKFHSMGRGVVLGGLPYRRAATIPYVVPYVVPIIAAAGLSFVQQMVDPLMLGSNLF
jgi:hypothetical protein